MPPPLLRRRLIATAAALPPAGLARAQGSGAPWAPDRPVRFVVGFPPGGSADALSRKLAEPLGRLLGQPVVVDNRPGAGANIAMDIVAKSPPDGHTIGLGPVGPHAVNVALLGSRMPYDAARDFTPILRVMDQPNILLAHLSVPQGGEAFLGWLRAHPEEPYGSPGVGSSNHLNGEMLSRALGLRLQHVPYRGGAAGLADLMGGQIRLYIDNLGGALGLLRAGRFRGVAVSTPERSPAAPEVPTFTELGLPDIAYASWQGIFAPARLPAPVLRRWNAAFNEVIRDPDIAAWMRENAGTPVGGGAEEFAAFLARERTRWAEVVRATGVTVD